VVAVEIATELEVQIKIRQPKELEVFNSLSLSMVVLVKILVKLAGGTELKARAKIR